MRPYDRLFRCGAQGGEEVPGLRREERHQGQGTRSLEGRGGASFSGGEEDRQDQRRGGVHFR